MKLTEKISQAISQSENFNRIINFCDESKCKIVFNKINFASVQFQKNGAEICLGIECIYTLNDKTVTGVEQFQFKVGISTPKGYFSSKKIDCKISDNANLTEQELTDLMEYYNQNTKENTFNPFWFEKNQQSKNAHGWSFVASKLQSDCR